MSKLSKSRLLLSDGSGITYRLCNFSVGKDQIRKEPYFKFMFPELRFRPKPIAGRGIPTSSTSKMSEISFHYQGGVITPKHSGLYSEVRHGTQTLEKMGFLPLLTIELVVLSCLKEFNVARSNLNNDTILHAPWTRPRGFTFIISKERIGKLAVEDGAEILGVYDLQDVGTGLFLKLADYHLSQNAPKSPMRLITYTGTAEQLMVPIVVPERPAIPVKSGSN